MNMEIKEIKTNAKIFTEYYNLDHVEAELDLWYNLLKKKNVTNPQLMTLHIVDMLKDIVMFFPDVKKGLLILISIPPTTANIDRLFSTLRRVKTWLRSTMMKDRLSGNCN